LALPPLPSTEKSNCLGKVNGSFSSFAFILFQA
jgi:hypothetical protein